MDGAIRPVPQAAASTTPQLALNGFSGSLDHLLALARAHQVDLANLPLCDLTDQLAAAVQQATPKPPLDRQADWLVMAAWLLLLRSLLLPGGAPAEPAALAEAGGLQARLRALGTIQALAAWLHRRPQLGRDVFACGQPALGAAPPGGPVDVVEFLWASLALFDDDLPGAVTEARYRPAWLDLHSVLDARARIRHLLADAAAPLPFERLLPAAGAAAATALRVRSGWASSFVASLELAKLGEAHLSQDEAFAPIHVAPLAVSRLGTEANV